MNLSAFLTLLYSFLSQFNTKVNVPPCTLHFPDQIRISIKNATAVSIGWRTPGFSNGTNDTPYPHVEYNTDNDFDRFYYNSSNGMSSNYDKLNVIAWFHETIMNVDASKTYYYRIAASGSCVNQSAVYNFTAQPEKGAKKPINITIVGDLGYDTEPNHHAASQTIAALKEAIDSTSFFLHIGDISYADEQKNASLVVQNYENYWNNFQSAMEPITRTKFYMTLPGNHEVTCSQYGHWHCDGPTLPKKEKEIASQYKNFNAYLNRFNMPGDDGQSNGSYRNMWYSFDYGLAHIIIINTETDFDHAPSLNFVLDGKNMAPDGTQIAWLIKDLKTANSSRNDVPWIIVAGHRPFFSSKPTPSIDGGKCDPCKKAFAQILFDYSVDFYFCGHVHWYERLLPVDADGIPTTNPEPYINQTWPIHITTGAGGAPEKAQNISEKSDKIKASADLKSTYGYSQLQIQDATRAQLIFYDSITKNITDSVEIVRRRSSSKSQPKPHPTCH